MAAMNCGAPSAAARQKQMEQNDWDYLPEKGVYKVKVDADGRHCYVYWKNWVGPPAPLFYEDLDPTNVKQAGETHGAWWR